MIRMSLSENVNCIPKKIENKIVQEIKKINLYPHDYYTIVKEKLAEYYGVSSNNISISNGSDEMILNSCLAFKEPEKITLINSCTFDGYKKCLKITGHIYIEVPLCNNKIDLKLFYKTIDSKVSLIFLCNPHNPTGSTLNSKELEKFICYCHNKQIKVFIDEAYMEFDDNSSKKSVITLIPKYENLFVIKTFSKIYPMAGIRFGFIISSESNIKIIDEYKLPFNVNRISCVMAIECIKDKTFLKNIVKTNASNKEYFCNNLRNEKIEFLESSTNFIMIKIPKLADEIANMLYAQYDIEVKKLSDLGLNDYLRVSVGTIDEINSFISAIAKIMLTIS